MFCWLSMDIAGDTSMGKRMLSQFRSIVVNNTEQDAVVDLFHENQATAERMLI